MPNTHRSIHTEQTAINPPNMWLQACIHNHLHTQVLVLVCKSVCACVRKAIARGLNPHFCERPPRRSADPIPDPPHPESDRGWSASYFIERSGSTGSHMCAHAYNLTHAYCTHTFCRQFTDICLCLSPSSPLPSSSLHIGEARSSLSQCKHTEMRTHRRTTVRQRSVEWI